MPKSVEVFAAGEIPEQNNAQAEFRTFHPPFKSRTVAQAGPPSPAVPAMRASSIAPDFDSASSISSQVIAASGAFARLDQQDSACHA